MVTMLYTGVKNLLCWTSYFSYLQHNLGTPKVQRCMFVFDIQLRRDRGKEHYAQCND